MKSLRVALLGAVLLACGGSTASIPDGGAGADAAGGHEGGSGSSGGSSTGSGGGSSSGGSSGSTSGGGSGGGSSSGGTSGSTSGGGSGGGSGSGSSSGGATCNDLLTQIDQLRPGARMCCPTCNHQPCAFVVDDLCCPLTVDMTGSSSVVAFENAVKQFKADGCATACPAIACPVGPSGNCDPSTSLCQ